MINMGIDDLKSKTNSVYKLAILAAKRAQELNQGSEKLIEASIFEKPTTTALREILANKITYKIREK